MTVVDIVCATYNGARFLPEFLGSLRTQSHTDWRLWVRDDGSSDSTVGIVRQAADADARIVLLYAGGPPGGATRAFAWLLDHVPSDASYVMCADQDDVWLPEKIARTLAVMRAAESDAPVGTPMLVHTDMTVVDDRLNVLHRSFREFADRAAEPTTLRRMVVKNIATGAAMMLNRALLQLGRPVPAEAILHDWWFACVAAAMGRIVSVPESTMLYRQHGGNAVGAQDWRVTWRSVLRFTARSLKQTPKARADLGRMAEQARALLERYRDQLGEDQRAFLSMYAGIPHRRAVGRKLALIRLGRLPEHGRARGVLRTLSILVRG